MKIFCKEREKISRKPCEDFVDSVATSLNRLGIPIIVKKEEDYSAVSRKDINFSAEIKLQASTFAGTMDDHFFAYNIYFKGSTEIEKELQKIVVNNIFKDIPTWPKYDRILGEYKPYDSRTYTYSDFSRLKHLNSATPNSIAQNIYNTIRIYTNMKKDVGGLIEKLQAIEKEKQNILHKFNSYLRDKKTN